MPRASTSLSGPMIEDILTRLSVGETVVSLAEDYGMSKGSFYRAMARAGVARGGEIHKPFTTLRRRVGEMRAVEAVDMLLDLVEMLVGYSETEILGPKKEGFAPQESRVLLHLLANRDLVVRREKLFLLSSQNASSPETTNSDKIVDVLVSKIRRKAREKGYPLTISCEWGVGYVAHVEEGFVFPWEVSR